MSAALDSLLAQVHLTHAATVLPAWLERAAQDELSYADFLAGLLEEEWSGFQSSAESTLHNCC